MYRKIILCYKEMEELENLKKRCVKEIQGAKVEDIYHLYQ